MYFKVTPDLACYETFWEKLTPETEKVDQGLFGGVIWWPSVAYERRLSTTMAVQNSVDFRLSGGCGFFCGRLTILGLDHTETGSIPSTPSSTASTSNFSR
ncbi:hypothetical protein CCACVL1_28112 [Corchorus capsularis]|uniref:Uncharacterized protein n=1 Tax=Corchorus capsularis TaxID=210143 RepID=A0A1R3G7G8_COCAP|nr:hypothetical protein CCACVL1_28112 [Corchorus capsularis]